MYMYLPYFTWNPFKTPYSRHVQSNLSNMDTEGTEQSVHIREVSILERCPYWRSLWWRHFYMLPQKYFWLHCTVLAFVKCKFWKLTFWYCSGIGTAEWQCQCLCNHWQEMVHTANYRHLIPGVSITKRLHLYEFAP